MVDVKPKSETERAIALREIEAQAKEAKLGKHEMRPTSVGSYDNSWTSYHYRDVDWNPDNNQIYKEYKGKVVKAIIEEVRDGSCVRCELLISDRPIKTKLIWLELSGVECPRTPKPVKTQEKEFRNKAGNKKKDFIPIKAPAFAEKAKMETMIRLLHRDVDVIIEAKDAYNNLYGAVIFHRGGKQRDIRGYLLSNGFGKVVPWTALVSGKLNEFCHMESQAKKKKKHIWEKIDEAEEDNLTGKTFTAVVKEITSGDSFFVLPEGAEADTKRVRLFLASVQAPRNRRNKSKSEPYFFEAKEFVRKELIEKTIKYEVEYTRPAQPNSPESVFQYVTVYLDNGRTLNAELVRRAFAKVVEHRKGEPRSKQYKNLLDLQHEAHISELNIHSPNTYSGPFMEDFTASPGGRRRGRRDEDEIQKAREKARRFALKHNLCESEADKAKRRQLERANSRNRKAGEKGEDGAVQKMPPYKPRKVGAVVEFVHTADRIKVRLMEEFATMNLILSGIDVKSHKDKEIEEAATKEIRDMLTQREVEVEFEKVDRNANWIGNIYYEGTDISEYLLANGMAKIFMPRNPKAVVSVRKSLREAQKSAQERRAGCWEKEPPVEEKKEEAVEVEEAEAGGPEGQRRGRGRGRQGTRGRGDGADGRGRGRRRGPQLERITNMKVEVTQLLDCVTFFARNLNDPRAKQIEEYMSKVNPADNTPLFDVKNQDKVAGLYEQDGKYYRCRILNSFKDDENGIKQWRCDWIDFGQRGVIKQTQILSIANADPQVRDGPGLAMKFVLAGLKPPPLKSTYYDTSCMRFWSEISGGTIMVKILRQARDIRYCRVTVNGEELNDKMVAEGILRVQTGRGMRETPEYKAKLYKLQQEAKDRHVGLWEYGDLGSDEEDDEPRGRGRQR